MAAYYNEFEPSAAAWLRELIRQGHIAPGDVDERSIEDVRPDDLRGYTQFHAFAGIGVWSYALRRAGWPDDLPVWTGSPPCQPFSAAGKGGGTSDERHLWPAYFHLIDALRPEILFGEQVASKDGLAWLDLVQSDLEGAGYAVGAVDLCAPGFGAPHIRQRLYFGGARGVGDTSGRDFRSRLRDSGSPGLWGPEPADTGGARRLDHHHHQGLQRYAGDGDHAAGRPLSAGPASPTGSDGRLAHNDDTERRTDGSGWDFVVGEEAGRLEGAGHPGPGGGHGGMADGTSLGRREEHQDGRGCAVGDRAQGFAAGSSSSSDLGMVDIAGPGPTNGHWGDADWLFCRDGKWRPVEPDTFPLADRAPARVGRLRGYGNAIVAQVAEGFVRSFVEALGDVADSADRTDSVAARGLIEYDLSDILT